MSGASENVTALKPRSALRRISCAGDLGIAEVRDLVRHEALGMRAAPRFEMPVVVRAHRDERELVGVGPQREPLADEAGQERREAERRPHAVDVHVGDARVHVPRAASHLVEAGRLEAVLARRPTDHRVEADVGELLALPDPRLAAVVGVDDARLVVGEALREASGERVGRLDHVIVDRDHGVHAFARLRLRQPRDLLAPALAPAERLAARKIVERHVHAAATSGPRSPVRLRSTDRACGSAPGLFMRLRPPALDRPCDFGRPTGPPDLRLACSCGCDLHSSTSGSLRQQQPGRAVPVGARRVLAQRGFQLRTLLHGDLARHAPAAKVEAPAASAVTFPTPYQAVLLSNNSVYFGKLAGYGTSNPVLTEVYYIISKSDPTTKQVQNILVKRGKELHGPDRMYLNPNQIVFVEPVGTDSKVAQLISEASKQQ